MMDVEEFMAMRSAAIAAADKDFAEAKARYKEYRRYWSKLTPERHAQDSKRALYLMHQAPVPANVVKAVEQTDAR